jgi:SAM-dependent methyltransferase
VLDIGCGAGTSTVEAARRVPEGEAVGVDLSSRMLDVGRKAAAEAGIGNVTFLQADAQTHRFEPDRFDVAISAFGVMFFDDPVAAYANVRRALRPAGTLTWLVWRELERNEWVSSFRAALAAGRDLPTPPPGGPHPFGMADQAITAARLRDAGFDDVAFEAVEAPMRFGRDLDEAWSFVSSLGIARGLTADLDDEAREGALVALRATVEDHVSGDGVAFDSSAWCITARNPA